MSYARPKASNLLNPNLLVIGELSKIREQSPISFPRSNLSITEPRLCSIT